MANKHLRFLLRALPLTVVMVAAALYATTRYEIGIDPQKNTCLDWRVFVVDRFDTEVERDKIYAFKSTQMEPFFRNGTKIIKYVRGVPGDQIKVSEMNVLVNGLEQGRGLMLAERLNKPNSRFVREEVVPDGKLWFMGTSKDSFDSRYWGYAATSDVIGRAYPIW
ncbi:signal peptidase I [Pseudomonas sp. LS-2]|uniref:signal peptidase I n=1 Tax=Pseudomonas sp. LS-2 TaxID=2315859 RepID=UPI000E76BF8A|nr:signal peptidase I [Pseudomonas sp. LS-2]RJX72632.1 signal peptidase I [Pseudomonas sp. LS-2]